MGGFGSPDSEARLFRYTVGKWSKEFGYGIFLAITIWRLTKYTYRHLYIFTRHPAATAATLAALVAWIVNPLILLTACAAAYLALGLLMWKWPHHYRHHIEPRYRGHLHGLKFKWRFRRKMMACGLIDKDDPTPIPIRTVVHGCTSTMLIKMVPGQEIEWYRVRSARLAQTFKALDCKANPYRVGKSTKPQYVQLQLLARDPFVSNLGIEFIDYHRSSVELFNTPSAVHRSGKPYFRFNPGMHLLLVAMTRRGKSNAIRAMVYADRDAIQLGLIEYWGLDGKGGVEVSFMQNQFARYCYGDAANPEKFDPMAFARILDEAVQVMMKRQKRMRGIITEHIPTTTEPWVKIVVDELLVMTSKLLPPEIRNAIAANIMLIQQQGVACGVTLIACSQLAQKEVLPFRDGFPEVQVGKIDRNAVDMVMGTGSWEAGARTDEIPDDLPGVFYAKTDYSMTPEQIRYVGVQPDIIRALPAAQPSVLWPPKKEPVGIERFGGFA